MREQEKNIDRRNLFGFMEGPSLKVLKRRTNGIYVKKESTVTITSINSPNQCCGMRVHHILVWIRIRGSMPLTYGSGSFYFRY
jgi:hypothetical protein